MNSALEDLLKILNAEINFHINHKNIEQGSFEDGFVQGLRHDQSILIPGQAEALNKTIKLDDVVISVDRSKVTNNSLIWRKFFQDE